MYSFGLVKVTSSAFPAEKQNLNSQIGKSRLILLLRVALKIGACELCARDSALRKKKRARSTASPSCIVASFTSRSRKGQTFCFQLFLRKNLLRPSLYKETVL